MKSQPEEVLLALSILDEAAERIRFIILTCHPERYRALSYAEFRDLDAIVNQ